jgi:dolichyl-phosphate-mannose-protein mannosyltransferase
VRSRPQFQQKTFVALDETCRLKFSGYQYPTWLPEKREVRANEKRSLHSTQLWLILAGLTILYAGLAVVGSRRFLWYDELLTYYIAAAPTLHKLIRLLHQGLDFQLLPGYLLSRFSMSLFGANQYAVRLPSILEFYAASIFLFLYLRRKAPTLYATFAVLMLWCSPIFRYATEARPYALLLLFFFSLLLSWDFAKTERPSWAVWMVAVSSLGMILAHAFAPLSVFPFLVAEGVGFARQRKVDYPLWAGLLLPIIGVVTYIPLSHSLGVLFPHKFEASFKKMISFFYHATTPLITAAILTTFTLRLVRRKPKIAGSEFPPMKIEEVVLFVGLLLNPIFVNLALMPHHVAFWDRYCITTSAVIYIGIALILSRLVGADKLATSTACLMLIAFLCVHGMFVPLRQKRPRNAASLQQVRPDLPLVVASPLAFLEMNHIEGPQILSRLYFLSDRGAAVQYAHATHFEDLEPPAKLKRYFGLRGNAESYRDFTRLHRTFVVLGAYDFPEDWLLRKLQADGATLKIIGRCKCPYRDKDIYLVSLPENKIQLHLAG